MVRTIITIGILFCSLNSYAMDKSNLEIFSQPSFVIRQLPDLKKLNLKVGEFQNRDLKKSGLRLGTLKSWVDREESDGVWLLNEVKVILKPKQLIEVLIQRKTGKILKYIVDGEEKTPPDVTKMEDCEVLSEAAETIKVRAGTYKTERTIAKCDEDIMAVWTNYGDVNMGGFVRLAALEDEDKPNKQKYTVDLVQFGKK